MNDTTPAGRARALLQKHGTISLPLSSADFAEAEGVTVRLVDYPSDLQDKRSAHCEPGERTICVSRALPPGLRNAAIAHQLGHIVLHGDFLAAEGQAPMGRGAFPDPAPACREDREADEFAMALLAPEDLVEDLLDAPDAEIARALNLPLTAARALRRQLAA